MTSSIFGSGGSAGSASSGKYRVGFRPAWRLLLNGEVLATAAVERGASAKAIGYQAAIQRVECTLGLDIVNTATITVVGEEAAKMVKERIAKLTEVELEIGYADYPSDFQKVFRGYAVQAYPNGTNPVTVEVEFDSPVFQARESRESGDNTDPNQAEYIASRLSVLPNPLTANLGDVTDPQADEGGASSGSLLSFMQSWAKTNFVHWLDQMDGHVHFFYPGAKPQTFRPWRGWDLSVRRTKHGDENPPILNEWSPALSYVESPYTIRAVWYDDGDVTLANPEPVQAENLNGVPDSSLDLGFLSAKDKNSAQAIVDAAAENYYWSSIEGGFALSAGLPILPLDEITARNGPVGLEDLYDRPMEVVEVTHVLNEKGWSVRGTVRGGRA